MKCYVSVQVTYLLDIYIYIYIFFIDAILFINGRILCGGSVTDCNDVCGRCMVFPGKDKVKSSSHRFKGLKPQ